MAFNPKSKEEFLNSLKDIQINPPPEATIINNFTPKGLSDLYELFLSLKGISLDNQYFSILLNKISSHYSEDIIDFVHNPIGDNEINQLLEIIKQEYLEIVHYNNPNKVSKEEQEALKIIVNKNFPSVFLDFIKKPVSSATFKKQHDLIRKTVIQLSDAYYEQASSHGQDNSSYLSSAIYLVYKKLLPELSITEPSREKGLKSFDDNINKELNKGVQNTIPRNIETGITLSDLKNNIVSNSHNPNNFADKTNSDFSGITIVLNHIDDVMFFDEADPENAEIIKLKKQKDDNLRFLQSLRKYLNENDMDLSQEEYFQIYIELLHRLQDSTYPECTHEIREGNYSSRLDFAVSNYKKLALADSFEPKALVSETDTLYTLADCLSRRLYDKLENEVLLVTFPHVLADPLLKDDFKITGKFVKFIKKENGFCAIYYELTDALGRKIEVQLQSNMRYKESKNGLSTHSDMPNKKADIRHFFELTDHRDNPELLNSYLSLLDRTSKKQEEALKVRLENLQQKLSFSTTSPEEKRKLQNSIRRISKKVESIETAKANIKIKDEFVEEFDMIDIENTMKEDNYELKNIGDKTIKVYDTKTTKRIEKMKIEDYLPIYAEYHSPASMKIISSAHATAPEAYVNKKDLIESFTEILRRGDEITYLSEFLLDKLEQILETKNENQISLEELKRYAHDTKNGFYAPMNPSSNPRSSEDTELDL